LSLRTSTAVVVTLLLWSSAFAGIREGLAGGYTPGHLVLLRFLSASAVFAVYAGIRRIALPKPKDVVRIALLSFVGISIYHITLTFGEQTVPAGTASLIIAAAPTFTALIAAFVLKERLNRMGWLGLGIGFLGILFISLSDTQAKGFTMGALLILISAVATAIFFVYQKPLFQRYKPIDLTAYFTWFGTIPFLVFSPGLWHQIHTATTAATWSVIYIGVFPAAIAYVSWAIALSRATAGRVTSALYVNPVLSVLIAWVWLKEIPHTLSLIGGGIAMVGLLMVSLKSRSKTTNTRVHEKEAASEDSANQLKSSP